MSRVTIRIEGLPGDVEKVGGLLRAVELLLNTGEVSAALIALRGGMQIVNENGVYRNRPPSKDVRKYVEVEIDG